MTDARKLYEIQILVSINRECPEHRQAHSSARGPRRPLHKGALVWLWQRLCGCSA